MWANLFRVVQFGVRYGVLVYTITIPLKDAIRFSGQPVYVDEPVASVPYAQAVNSIADAHPETGEGIDMVERSDELISFSENRPGR